MTPDQIQAKIDQLRPLLKDWMDNHCADVPETHKGGMLLAVASFYIRYELKLSPIEGLIHTAFMYSREKSLQCCQQYILDELAKYLGDERKEN